MKKTFVPWKEAELPAKTKSYSPVGHQSIINLIDERLEVHGFRRTSLRVDQTPDGEVIMGHMGIERDYGYEEFYQEMLFGNSYNKKKPVLFASGARVWACTNGMISAEFTTVRKHTTNIWNEIQEKCDDTIIVLDKNWQKVKADIDLMQNVDMTFSQQCELLGLAFFEEKILNTVEASIAIKELREPTFAQFQPKNLWSFYNACTYALNNAHVLRKSESLKNLHDFAMDYANDITTVND